MKPPADPRFAFLQDPDLYDLVGRLALKIVGDVAFAEDIRNGAYVVAMQLVLMQRTPRPGMERGWMCRVARNHTYAEIRRRKKKEEPPLEDDDAPDLPVEDHQTLYEEQLRVEKLFDAAEQVAEEHPREVARIGVADGRTREGKESAAAPQDAASRKRKARAREVLASAISAAIAAAVVLLWLRRPPQPTPGLPAGAYSTLSDATHELARRSCAAKQWVACLEELEQLGALDPAKVGPPQIGARKAAVAGLRQQALAACASGDDMTCLEGLDTARRYDPAGDADPTVTLARSEAERRVRGPAPAPAPAPFQAPDAKPVPLRHP